MKKNVATASTYAAALKEFFMLEEAHQKKMKSCKKCGVLKDENAYELYRNTCKICRNERRKEYRTRSGEGLKNYRLKRQYGITIEDYNRMLKDQNGVCFICQKESKNFWGTQPAVDHCHKTGKIRGLLCDKCNKGLGQFNDNPELLQKAIKYLKG